MRSRLCARAPWLRSGVTLIELLIVMAVLTILATLSLTTVKGLLKDQKTAQAARLVEQYLETARLRAITNRRPVAVFLERVSLDGDTNGDPLEGNFVSTRLSIGEVFPAYSGDVINAQGELWDVDFTLNSAAPAMYPNRPSRGGTGGGTADGFADQLRLTPGLVFSGFGTPTEPGMIAVGDTIEFPTYSRRFVIESIDWVTGMAGTPQVAITFFNPPSPLLYNGLALPPREFEPGFSELEPSMPIKPADMTAVPPTVLAVAPGVDGSTSGFNAVPNLVPFRVYRRPTKSMLGAVTLPRGTCIDLYASGIGPSSSAAAAVDSGELTPFFPRSGHPTLNNTAPAHGVNLPLRRSSFSRVAIVFDETGRVSGMFRDDKIIGASGVPEPFGFTAFNVDSVLHLLVGKVDGVLIGVDSTQPGFRMADATAADRDEELANILDPNNSWVSINPLTGQVKSSPVNRVSDATLSSAITNQSFAEVVTEARRLSTVGVRNAGN